MKYSSATPGFSEHASIQGEIRGYRWWRVTEQGLLESPYHGAGAWRPHVNRAICAPRHPQPGFLAVMIARYRLPPGDALHDSPAPEVECACGFYGLWDLPSSSNRPAYAWRANAETSVFVPGELVLGIASAWGRILLGSEGWRAEYARPVAILVPAAHGVERLVADAQAAYPKLAILATPQALVEFRPERV